jgi:hypothetical protein
MADQNQPPQPPQPPQQQINRGVPGTRQPPVPDAAQIAKAVAEQQQALAQQRAEAQQRAQGIPGTPAPAAAPAPSPVPGMTAESVLAGPPQSQRLPQAQQPQMPQNQFSQQAKQVQVEKPVIPWFPIRSRGVDIELEDSIITSVPETGLTGEGDAAAKVVLALFGEILFLRELVVNMSNSPAVPANLENRIANLEGALFEQRKSLSTQARSMREQIEMFTKQGMSPDEILESLKAQSIKAEQQASSGA